MIYNSVTFQIYVINLKKLCYKKDVESHEFNAIIENNYILLLNDDVSNFIH